MEKEVVAVVQLTAATFALAALYANKIIGEGVFIVNARHDSCSTKGKYDLQNYRRIPSFCLRCCRRTQTVPAPSMAALCLVLLALHKMCHFVGSISPASSSTKHQATQTRFCLLCNYSYASFSALLLLLAKLQLNCN